MLTHVRKYDIYLPLQDNNGRFIEEEKFDQVDDELFHRFGGVTSIMREFPLRGIWGQDNIVYRDLIIIYTTIDFQPSEEATKFFSEYKKILESRFEQEGILITVQEIGIFQ